MMNKKAIAAFAAGATLLAGFAMATPAMAEETPVVYVSVAKAKTAAAYEAYTKAKAVYDGMTVTPKPEEPLAVVNVYINTTPDPKTGLIALAHGATTDSVVYKLYVAAQDYVKAFNANVTETKAKNAKAAEVQDLLNKYLAAKAAEANAVPDPVEPTLAEKQKKAIADVYTAAQKVDQTKNDFAHTHETFVDAAKKLKAAKAELAEAQAKLDAALAAVEDFKASGVKDDAKLERLVTAYNRAVAHVKRVNDIVLAAKSKAYGEAQDANDKAQGAYNKAVEAYKAAYNHAVELNVNPDLLPKITLVDPASDAFPELSEAKKIYDDALSGKFGAAAQKAVQTAEAKAKAEAGKNAPAAAANGAAAPAAAAGKAGAAAAKGELATKGGNGHGGKAGEKLGNAGVGVALTALAASMLAGMGAAVRKMRH
ncbi:hypothetical protein ACMZ89_03310 [Gardnerella vaginalis]|uniref:hypothetical protein n=1 Tax=Gardnerella vaginalis TaxID=2702 RepID=UPI0039EE5903